MLPSPPEQNLILPWPSGGWGYVSPISFSQPPCLSFSPPPFLPTHLPPGMLKLENCSAAYTIMVRCWNLLYLLGKWFHKNHYNHTLWSSFAPVGNFTWNCAELGLLSMFPSPRLTQPDLTRRSLKIASYSKTVLPPPFSGVNECGQQAVTKLRVQIPGMTNGPIRESR